MSVQEMGGTKAEPRNANTLVSHAAQPGFHEAEGPMAEACTISSDSLMESVAVLALLLLTPYSLRVLLHEADAPLVFTCLLGRQGKRCCGDTGRLVLCRGPAAADWPQQKMWGAWTAWQCSGVGS